MNERCETILTLSIQMYPFDFLQIYLASDYTNEATIEPHNEMSVAPKYPHVVSYLKTVSWLLASTPL